MAVFALLACQAGAITLSNYNITWTTQSTNINGSMPIGNGETGCNVWVQDNAIHLLIARTDAWNESGGGGWGEGMCPKLAKVDVQLSPNPFGGDFSQILRLQEGEVEVSGGSGAGRKTVLIWADANASTIHLEYHGGQPATMTVSVDQSWGTATSRTVSAVNNTVVFYHRNPATSSIWNSLTTQQKVVKSHFADPLSNRTFGGIITGSGFTASGSTLQLANDTAAVCHIVTHTSQAASVALWTSEAQAEAAKVTGTAIAGARTNHARWWSDFWARSWIELDAGRTETTRNYLLQRYVNACEGRGAYPAKFNGSLFNFTDERAWGGCYWFQNMRLMYWPNLASADFDLMQPFFKMYLDMMPIRKEQTQAQFNHDGLYFPETVHFFGLWANGDYNDGINVSTWIGLHYNGTLELLAMMIDYYDYTDDVQFAQENLVPYAREALRFWDVHWPRSGGKLSMLANALETYWKVTNP